MMINKNENIIALPPKEPYDIIKQTVVNKYLSDKINN